MFRKVGKEGLGGEIALVLEIGVRLKLLERRECARLGEICEQRKGTRESLSLG